MLLSQLPAESAYHRAVRGENAEWKIVEHELAHVIDLLQVANAHLFGLRGGKPKAPKPFYRPKSAEPTKQRTIEERAADWRKRHGKG